ncbi:MAG: glutamine--tRNA ligase, partial [Chitinophagaceae bacterium]|nr:glutamine--tRNA ligase [Chitinophagaceae bacterium]
VITNYPEGGTEMLSADNNTENESAGTRTLSFGPELYIEREDFMEEPPKKFFRLGPGLSVRLKHAYIITCNEVVRDAEGTVTELHCSYYPDSKSGSDTSGIQVKGVIHWVNAADAVAAEVRLYNRLFTVEDPANAEGDFKDHINPASMEVIHTAMVEPSLLNATPGTPFQFLRKGYFCVDNDSNAGQLVFNQTVGLKDTFAKEMKK